MRAGYFELFDWLEQSKPVQPREFFDRMRTAYGITHLVYIDVFASSRSAKIHRLHHTFSPSQATAISGIGNEILLPTLKFVLSSVRPIDHTTLRQQIPAADTLFRHAGALGIPTEGISYPLLAPAARAAALVVSMPLPSEEIPLFLRSYGRDIQTLATLFHASMIESERPPSISKDELRRITPREREVLRWAAAGKSYWEIAIILGITERTVRFFMSNARQKLDVVSNTQAIAEAVWRGLIPQS
jgi:LuxR family transcriptional regulator, quorum-sensing system regulator SinR